MGISANWSRENLAWAAGLFEGEGNIYPPMNRMSIAMTDKDVLDHFLWVVGCGKIESVRHINKPSHWKPQWRWLSAKQEHTQALLAAFWPWLHSRRKAKAEEFMRRMAVAHLRRPHYGHENGKAKLTEEQVREILVSRDTGVRLARLYGVTETNISSIRKRQTWRHVSVPIELLEFAERIGQHSPSQ